MNFIEELEWRGMLYNYTEGVEKELQSGMTTGYIGFDPTAPSLTIGNYVQIRILDLFQKSGHRPIFLLGGATGRIGDPSGRDQERVLKSYEELDRNLTFQKEQASKYLDFESGSNKALMHNNHDFYKDMNVLDFLRDVGKSITISYMLSKDAVKSRLETGLSFTEFSYQLLQAYDFMYLYQHYDCKIQMGGSDQWGNITSGTEFIRKNLNGKAYAITTPLLTKSDGSKFGKSESGNIWLDPELTSPYQFYQFWINADDADVPKFLRYFSDKSRKEIETLEEEYSDDPRGLKKILSEELTESVHSKEDLESVEQVSELLFNRNTSKEHLSNMNKNTLELVSREIPSHLFKKVKITDGIRIDQFCVETGSMSSTSDVRRAIQNNALSINKEKIGTVEYIIGEEHLIKDKYIMVEPSKKKKIMIIAED